MFLPKAKTEDIVVQEAGRELLIYDLLIHKAYNLNETSRIIFEACDGKTTFEELKDKYNFSGDLIRFALDELDRLDLITGDYRSTFENIPRREVIRKIGLASMIAIPVIASTTAPGSAQAQSCLGSQVVFSCLDVNADSSVCVGQAARLCCSGNPSIFGSISGNIPACSALPALTPVTICACA